MAETLLILNLVLALAALVGIAILFTKKTPPPDLTHLQHSLETLSTNIANSARENRTENATQFTNLRTENAAQFTSLRAEIVTQLERTSTTQSRQLDGIRDALTAAFDKTRAELTAAIATARAEQNTALNATQSLLSEQLERSRKTLQETSTAARTAQDAALNATQRTLVEQLERLRNALQETTTAMRTEQTNAAAELRKTLDSRLETLATQNAAKLEEMRLTVDEKLQSTLEKRLGENFKQVSERLENVHKSLGEMQSVATDVGDLKRVLSNVKTRGTWGGIQLGSLLENLLQPGQYAANVKPNPRAETIVEFAIRLPGPEDGGKPLWLPIDAKFPKEDYERLADAARRADSAAVEQATTALAAFVKKSARDIRDKYIQPPHTTDFAILFLPTEGLYAEILRSGIAEEIQRELRVLIAGPTILGALLNSLQMGFRTLAIQKKSSEVWKLLGAVKTQFGTFGELLSKVGKKLEEASTVVNQASHRQNILSSRLAKIEALPESETNALLPELDDSPTSTKSPEIPPPF